MEVEEDADTVLPSPRYRFQEVSEHDVTDDRDNTGRRNLRPGDLRQERLVGLHVDRPVPQRNASSRQPKLTGTSRRRDGTYRTQFNPAPAMSAKSSSVYPSSVHNPVKAAGTTHDEILIMLLHGGGQVTPHPTPLRSALHSSFLA